MKLNWGHYIVIGFIGFVILILFMVFRSYQHNNDLVSEDYYAEEIAFQDVIDKKSNFLMWQVVAFHGKNSFGNCLMVL